MRGGLLPVARLALMADREDLDPVRAGRNAIQRDVAGAAMRNNELAQPPADGPTDLRMPLEDPHRIEDRRSRRACNDRAVRSEVVEQAIQIC